MIYASLAVAALNKNCISEIAVIRWNGDVMLAIAKTACHWQRSCDKRKDNIQNACHMSYRFKGILFLNNLLFMDKVAENPKTVSQLFFSPDTLFSPLR